MLQKRVLLDIGACERSGITQTSHTYCIGGKRPGRVGDLIVCCKMLCFGRSIVYA